MKITRSPRMRADAFWTFTNNVLGVVCGIAIFRIISKVVTAADYGKAALVLGIVGLLTQFIAGPKILAHLRLYFEHSRGGRGPMYEVAVRRVLLGTAAWMAAAYLVFAAVNRELSNPTYWVLALPAMLLLVLQTQLTGTFAFLEAQRR